MFSLKELTATVEKFNKLMHPNFKVAFSPFVPADTSYKLTAKDNEIWFFHSSYEQEFREHLPAWIFISKTELMNISVFDFIKPDYSYKEQDHGSRLSGSPSSGARIK